jgi:hypothetical protein
LPLDQLDYERSVKHKISRYLVAFDYTIILTLVIFIYSYFYLFFISSGLDSIVIDEYAPSIFAQIREMSNVSQSSLIVCHITQM